MPDINRRRFLIASAGVGAAGLPSTAVAVNWPDLMRAAQDRPLADDAGVLVIVTLYGEQRRDQHPNPPRRQCLS